MPNFVPCRTGEDQEIHLYAGEEPEHALCGKSVDDPTTDPGGHPVCIQCGKRLLIRIFQLAGPDGIATVEVSVRTPS